MREIKPAAEHGIVHRFAEESCFNYCGWPTVCRDDRGILYAVASGMRMTHVDPAGKNCMWVSFNEGKTWTPTIVVHDSYFDDRDAGIVSLGGGKMVFTAFTESDKDYYKELLVQDWFRDKFKTIASGYSESLKTLSDEDMEKANLSFVMVSDDYGVTWSEPIEVELSAPHGPSVCKDGTLVYMGKQLNNGEWDSNLPIVVHTSRDGGKTWEYTGTVPVPDDITAEIMYEPHVIELPGGRLLGAIRVHNRPEGMTPRDTIYTTYSDDKGKTWSVPVCIGVDGLPPHLLVHSSGAVICSYACRTLETQSERAVVSYDNGE
ncbi:MAG: sialidase family protein, partial [Clostridia bacterium]|nr:sialidase family protein [Clostridia bacterium]